MADQETEQQLAAMRELLLETRHLDRRDFLRYLGGAAAVGMAGRAARAEAKQMATMGWGGIWQTAVEAAYCKPFTDRFHIPAKYVAPYDIAKLVAMDRAHDQQIDVVNLEYNRMVKLGINAPLDFKVIDRSALAPVQLRYPDQIGGVTLSTVMAYNTKKWPGEDHPNSWADFWDVKKYPGPRTMERQAQTTLEAALMADGVPADPAKMYPLDVDRAFRKLDEIKPHVETWWVTGTEPQQMMQDEEVDLCVVWNGRASDSINTQGVHYEIVWNQALYGASAGWLLVRNSPNPEAGMKFLDVVGRAEPQAVFAKMMYYGPTNPDAYKFLDDKLGRQLPSHPDNLKVALPLDADWWATTWAARTARFETWSQS